MPCSLFQGSYFSSISFHCNSSLLPAPFAVSSPGLPLTPSAELEELPECWIGVVPRAEGGLWQQFGVARSHPRMQDNSTGPLCLSDSSWGRIRDGGGGNSCESLTWVDLVDLIPCAPSLTFSPSLGFTTLGMMLQSWLLTPSLCRSAHEWDSSQSHSCTRMLMGRPERSTRLSFPAEACEQLLDDKWLSAGLH